MTMSDESVDTVVTRDGAQVLVTMDARTAEWLVVAIEALGEHIAAGAPINPMPTDANLRLGDLLDRLSEVV
jgi:hypothetical protein